MKKIKNKFIIIIIAMLLIILTIFFIQNTDTNLTSNATLKLGEANITRDDKIFNIEPKIPFILASGDIVTTQGTESLLIITWGDGSVTRMGGNSSIRIDNLNVKNDLSSIHISFELIAGKTWSNITSFFGEQSYFLQTFNDNEAAVRGTVFDVDLDNKYIHVSKHEVNITNKDGKIVTIGQDKVFNIDTFSFINLIDYINNYKDESWLKVNKQLDKLHFEDLKNILNQNLEKTGKFLELESLSDTLSVISDIESLTGEQKDKIYNELLSKYQKIHFADAKTPELLGLKLEIKQVMLEFANTQNEEHLIQSTLYDVEEVKETNNPYHFQQILNIFMEHKDVADRLNISLPTLFDVSEYSNDLKAVIFSQLDTVGSFLSEDSLQKLSEFNAIDLEKNLSKATQEFLDKNIGAIDFKGLGEKFKLTLPNFSH